MFKQHVIIFDGTIIRFTQVAPNFAVEGGGLRFGSPCTCGKTTLPVIKMLYFNVLGLFGKKYIHESVNDNVLSEN